MWRYITRQMRWVFRVISNFYWDDEWRIHCLGNRLQHMSFSVVAVLRLWHGGGYWSVVKISVVRLSEIFKSRLVCSLVLQLNDNSFNISNILTSSDNGPILCAPYRKRRHIFEGLLLRFWRKNTVICNIHGKMTFSAKIQTNTFVERFSTRKTIERNDNNLTVTDFFL